MKIEKTMVLSSEEVKGLIRIKDVIGAVERAFREYGEGKAQMPPKTYVDFPEYKGDLRVMPAYLPAQKIAGVKIVNVHPDNPGKGLPTVMATIQLNDPETGYPLAILAGTEITAARTGAAAAVATKYLSRKDAETIGLVGAGVQARTQLEAIMQVRKIKKAIVADASLPAAQRFAREMKEKTGLEIIATNELEKAVKCDIVSTTTPVRIPIVMDKWVQPGTHINAIGADAKGKEELEPEILKRARVFVDDWAQASHSGEINVPCTNCSFTKEDLAGSLGEVVAGMAEGRTANDQITVFDSTGLAIQDIATAKLVYERAVSQGLGRKIAFVNPPA